MLSKPALITCCGLMLAACGPSSGSDDDDDVTGDAGAADADPNRPDSAPPPENTFVFAHSSSELYKVDPDTLAVMLIGPFGWPSAADQMTDIAIDKNGYMVGISFDKVYAVNVDTAACSFLADLDRQFNGLSFVPAAEIDPTGDEVLVASALDGSFYEIDPGTGASSLIGNYGGGLTSSGDIVSVRGFGTVATVKQNGIGNDLLARVAPTTGVATVVGDTGETDIWGARGCRRCIVVGRGRHDLGADHRLERLPRPVAPAASLAVDHNLGGRSREGFGAACSLSADALAVANRTRSRCTPNQLSPDLTDPVSLKPQRSPPRLRALILWSTRSVVHQACVRNRDRVYS
jgi:hypothetical protein